MRLVENPNEEKGKRLKMSKFLDEKRRVGYAHYNAAHRTIMILLKKDGLDDLFLDNIIFADEQQHLAKGGILYFPDGTIAVRRGKKLYYQRENDIEEVWVLKPDFFSQYVLGMRKTRW